MKIDGFTYALRVVFVLFALFALACVVGGWMYAGLPHGWWDYIGCVGTHLVFAASIAGVVWAFSFRWDS